MYFRMHLIIVQEATSKLTVDSTSALCAGTNQGIGRNGRLLVHCALLRHEDDEIERICLHSTVPVGSDRSTSSRIHPEIYINWHAHHNTKAPKAPTTALSIIAHDPSKDSCVVDKPPSSSPRPRSLRASQEVLQTSCAEARRDPVRCPLRCSPTQR